MKQHTFHYDVIIVGSGIAGSTAALALAKNTSLKIAIIDSQKNIIHWNNKKYDFRVSAISLASQRIFQKLNVWEKIISKRISPYSQMQVWHTEGTGKIHFNCKDSYEPALGYIIEDNAIRISLWETFDEHSNINFLHPLQLLTLQKKSSGIVLLTDNNQIFSARLIIAADGADSWVRNQAKINLKKRDYGHTAIVTTVKTTAPHTATARQCFLTTGPLAFLPLEDSHTSSIVWSATHDYAKKLLAMDDEAFRDILGKAFDYKLGEIISVETRHYFPLQMRHAKNYVQEHIALIGDAAHTIHPLAGQGINLGLLDATALVEIIVESLQKQRDFASLSTLRRYERWRKGDNLAMITMIDMLKFLFSNEKKPLPLCRDFSLNLTNKISILKNFFVQYALGNRSDLPKIASKEIV